MEKIDRYYLEITSIKNLKGKDKPSDKTITLFRVANAY